MAEYVKHTGGSVAGKSKKPYDSMVHTVVSLGTTQVVFAGSRSVQDYSYIYTEV